MSIEITPRKESVLFGGLVGAATMAMPLSGIVLAVFVNIGAEELRRSALKNAEVFEDGGKPADVQRFCRIATDAKRRKASAWLGFGAGLVGFAAVHHRAVAELVQGLAQ